MSVKEYSLKRDGPTALAPNLRVREFACGDGSDAVLIDEELVIVLQCIREHFGKPLHITSGYRTASHNAAVGGSKSSQHLLGQICLPFSLLWVALSVLCIFVDDALRWRLFHEEKPRYRW